MNNPADVDQPWFDLRPWQSNLALALIGFFMICLSRQLVSEFNHFTIGFSGTSSSHFVLYLAALLIFLIKPTNTDRFTFPIILTIAIVCRLVVLFPEPILSSDVYRYAWDGVVQHARINPYRYVPGDKALAFLRAPNQDLFDNMNRRDYARTIYPPVAQAFFYVITFISPVVTFMKLVMVLFEGITVYGLILLLREMGAPREWIFIYAWCPLGIWEFGSSGHVDAMAIAFMVFALLFRYRDSPVLTGLFLGLAIFTKFYPLLLLPALYRRGDWKMPASVAAVALVFYAPYLSAGKLVFGFLSGYVQEEGISTGTRYFLLDLARHLPALHSLPNMAFMGFACATIIIMMLWGWRTGCRQAGNTGAFLPPAFALAFVMMLLFSPHYPWYVAWLIPFLVLMPNLTVLTYVGAVFYLCTTAMAVGYGPAQYRLNEYLYACVLVAIVTELAARKLPFVHVWVTQTLPNLNTQTQK